MSVFRRRREQLQTKLIELDAAGFLVTQNVDLYYFSGSMQTGYLFIPASGEPIFYVRRSMSRASDEVDCRVKPIGSFRTLERTLLDDFPTIIETQTKIIYTEFDVLPVSIYQKLVSALPSISIEDGSLLLREFRMRKSNEEIAKIQAAASVVDQALHASLKQLRVGMSEIEWMTVIEQELRTRGHLGIMRMRGFNQEIITGMVAAGAAAAIPTYFDGPAGGQGLHPAAPQGSSHAVIEAGSPILVDIGCCIEGYVIDQTRMVSIGTVDADLVEAYAISFDILQATEQNLRPGISCEELYLEACRMAEEAGLIDHFMGYGDDRVSFLGHGIGLEIDEWPVLAKGFTQLLEPGMVIAIEPKFSFPGRGVVGIEDTYLITEDGFERLTITPQTWYQKQL